MQQRITTRLASAAIAGLFLLAAHPAPAQDLHGEIEAIVKDYLATHPDEVGEIAKAYFMKHPEAIAQVLAEILKRRPAANASAGAGAPVKSATDHSAVVAANAAALFASPHQVTLGNADGDVTLVEFFDYSCGYCKRALPDMLALLRDDPKLKIALKEFPILGPGSAEAATVSVAVRMQDSDGKKYMAFHQQLLGGPGPVNKERALAAAKDQGLDMNRLEQNMASDEVGATIRENMNLARALGITGTPGYVIGNDVVLGAVGIAGLKQQIDAARGATAH
jgi:protein-disulfide isomerase